MSRFLSKAILSGISNARASQQVSTLHCSSLRWLSTTRSNTDEFFVVSYLTNSLGFSPKAALQASRFVKFDSPEKPDKTLEFYKGYGFTQSQISALVKGHPKNLICDNEKIMTPKLEFFLSKGISGSELAKGLSVYPGVLRSSLTNVIIPKFEFFRGLFQSDETTVRAILRFPDILKHDVEKQIVPNIAILRENGVSSKNIAQFILRNPRDVLLDPKSFRRIVEEVVAMGFDAEKMNFVVAVSVIRRLSKAKWERKVSVFKKWGWSEEDVLKAFRLAPGLRMISEDKISALMDFFVKFLGWRSSDISKCPVALSMSLEERVVPRFSVYRRLMEKGLLKKEISMYVFRLSNKEFLQKFVVCYAKEDPELMRLYGRRGSSFRQIELK